jgi:hypothetical protein
MRQMVGQFHEKSLEETKTQKLSRRGRTVEGEM